MEVAVNTIGGKLLLLKPTGPVGHWLDVSLSRFTPGAVVTLTLADGRRLSQDVRAGSSYLSSEDQRLHFGLGNETRVASLTVRYPSGGTSVLFDVRADRIVDVKVPPQHAAQTSLLDVVSAPDCKPTTDANQAATVWDENAVFALEGGNASDPVQARDLFDVSTAMWRAWKASAARAHLRSRRRDQLRRLPGAALGCVLQLEPAPNVR